MVWGGRRDGGSGWGTRVYLWQIHVDVWQNQYNIVKLNKIKLKKKEIKERHKETGRQVISERAETSLKLPFHPGYT